MEFNSNNYPQLFDSEEREEQSFADLPTFQFLISLISGTEMLANQQMINFT